MFFTEKPLITEMGPGVYSINCLGMQAPLLFVGTEKALLLDTGTGNVDVRAVAESLTDKPILVALTHEHGDHIGGICQFEEVYAPEKELATIQGTTAEFMQSFLDFYNRFLDEGDGVNGCFRQQKVLLIWEKLPRLLPFGDGCRFELGNRTVTAYHCPVHSPGHMVFVDDLSRTCYGGDSIGERIGPANNPMNPPTIVSLEGELWGIRHLLEHRGEFDRIIGDHPCPLERQVTMEPGVLDRLERVGTLALAGELLIHEEDDPGMGKRSYAQIGETRLYFFKEYLFEKDVPEKYR